MIWLAYAAVAGAMVLYLFLQSKSLLGWKGRYRLLGVLPLFWLVTWFGILVVDHTSAEPALTDHWIFEAIVGMAPSLVLLLILIMFHFINTGQWFETPDD